MVLQLQEKSYISPSTWTTCSWLVMKERPRSSSTSWRPLVGSWRAKDLWRLTRSSSTWRGRWGWLRNSRVQQWLSWQRGCSTSTGPWWVKAVLPGSTQARCPVRSTRTEWIHEDANMASMEVCGTLCLIPTWNSGRRSVYGSDVARKKPAQRQWQWFFTWWLCVLWRKWRTRIRKALAGGDVTLTMQEIKGIESLCHPCSSTWMATCWKAMWGHRSRLHCCQER